ncbi:Xaa-Pro peptidase family protein [Candidatus Bipolaricaulota bacterium]|nr:Xaa-Pro peptidase family protein [Candidatus Bipolaricaulota bacterium]
MDYQRRLDGLQQEMRLQGIDLVLYGSCPNYQYLTGIQVDWRGAPDLQPRGDLILVPRDGEPVLIASGHYPTDGCSITKVHSYDPSAGYRGMLRSIINDLALDVRKLALGSYLPIPAAIAAIAVTDNPALYDASHLMDRLRMVKEPEEVEALCKVAQLTDDVMMKVVGDIQEGVSQMDLIFEMESQARRMGATDVSFGPWACFVKSGSSTPFLAAHPNQVTDYPVDKGLVANTAITFDVGFVLDGYCSDWGRSVYWGSPPADVKKAYAAVRQSVVDTVTEIEPDLTKACDIYPAIEKKLDALGFGNQMRARLGSSAMIGHQIGTEVHENPWLRPDSTELLRAGMVMCIEPKLWVPGEYYLRLEEMVHVTETGAEFLTNFDRELFEL